MHQQPESYAEQFEKTSGLSEWLLWLVIMGGISGVLGVGLSTHNKDLIEKGMYVIISGLGLGLIVKGFWDAKFLDKEMKLASQQVKILEEVDDFEQFLHRAPPSVFKSHIDNLYTISLSHPEVSQDNLIEILQSRLLAKNKVVELFASVLITLGLIGTILGLMFMMDDLERTVQLLDKQGESNSILSELFGPGGAMTGLGVAFITTLLGAVLGGVILRVLTSIIDANIMKYIAHLAELTEVHVLPHMRKTALNEKAK
nr:MotA/TolQ/ExbB proton channel family protein [Nitrosomonas nitrosa]